MDVWMVRNRIIVSKKIRIDLRTDERIIMMRH